MIATPTLPESLTISDLRVSIGGSAILRGVNLAIRPKTVFCLMGRNGVGKSTTLKALMGLLPADSGKVMLEGSSIDRAASADRARLGLGYVPQGREDRCGKLLMKNVPPRFTRSSVRAVTDAHSF